jgi:hypothetical protein
MAELAKREETSARALKFAIVTAPVERGPRRDVA